jgi:hypothetical protein
MPPIISPSFLERRRDDARPGRVPLGQDVTRAFPVLSADTTPHTPLARWDFRIVGQMEAVADLVHWTVGLRPGVPA